MILAQYNPILFYTTKAARQWEKTANEKIIVTYPKFLDGSTEKCKIPPFNLIISSSDEAVHTFSGRVINCSDEEIETLASYSISNKGSYAQVIYTGADIECDMPGFYYIEITVDGTTYYSDMFEWSDDLDSLLKITADSSTVRIGLYDLDLFYTTHEFYVQAKVLSLNTYLKEEATEELAITSPIFGSSSIIRSLTVLATESIYGFFRGLRILSVNGEITVTWKNRTYSATDITVELEQDHGSEDWMNIRFEWKVLNESLSVANY